MATKKNYTKELYKTREDWLTNRGIGGSDAAAICGKSKWKTARDVYNNITDKTPKKEVKNARMVEGTKAEPHIRAMFELEHPEYKMTHPPKKGSWLFRRKDYPEITLTPDGLLEDLRTGEKLGYECKDIELRKREQKELWLNDTLPDEYYFQCLHYLVGKNDLDGVLLHARLKFYTFDYSNEYVLDHIEEHFYLIMRKDETVEKHLEYYEKKLLAFILYNLRQGKRPPVIINL